jgi:redox-sensing transcriptional repressor
MNQSARVPRAVIQRISYYLRQLERLRQEGVGTTSSAALGEAIGASDAQVRKDLACFGQFGRRGVGYDVAGLIGALRKILTVDREWRVVVVGAGNLGRALSTHRVFHERGFRIVAVFDKDPRKEGSECAGHKVRPMWDLDRTVRELEIRVGMIAVPAPSAQSVADQLVAAGVRGLLNFAPCRLEVPEGFEVRAVDFAVELQQLAFYVASLENGAAGSQQ